jgi:hypothetical protein
MYMCMCVHASHNTIGKGSYQIQKSYPISLARTQIKELLLAHTHTPEHQNLFPSELQWSATAFRQQTRQSLVHPPASLHAPSARSRRFLSTVQVALVKGKSFSIEQAFIASLVFGFKYVLAFEEHGKKYLCLDISAVSFSALRPLGFPLPSSLPAGQRHHSPPFQ